MTERPFEPADKAWVRAYVGRLRAELEPQVVTHADRFPDHGRLVERLDEALRSVEANGWKAFSAIDEAHNELCVAIAILASTEPKVASLEYEPSLPSTEKTIDFVLRFPDGKVCYVDVKTIAPATRDRWDQYTRAMKEGWLPSQTQIALEKEWLGGEIWHSKIAARSRMLEYAMELEAKVAAANLTGTTGCIVLLLCSNGFHWHEDELEDFVDFYLRGTHRADDALGAMEAQYMQEKAIRLARSIETFAYMERRSGSSIPNRLEWRVTPPTRYLGTLKNLRATEP